MPKDQQILNALPTKPLTFQAGRKFRIYPNFEQRKNLDVYFKAKNYLWNTILDLNQYNYQRQSLRKDLNIIDLPKRKTEAGYVNPTSINCQDYYRLDFNDFSKQLTEVLKLPEFAWLKPVPRSVFTCVLSDLEKSFKNFFSNPEHFAFPKKKKRGTNRSIAMQYDVRSEGKLKAWIANKNLILTNLGKIKVKYSKSSHGLNSKDYLDLSIPKSVCISQSASGKYFISFINARSLANSNSEIKPFMIEELIKHEIAKSNQPILNLKQSERVNEFLELSKDKNYKDKHMSFLDDLSKNKELNNHKNCKDGKDFSSILKTNLLNNSELAGFDLDTKTLLYASNGKSFTNSKSLYQYQHYLKKQQKILARKVLNSKRYAKQKLKVAKIHEKIANVRNDNIHKVTSEVLTRNNSNAKFLVLETLKLKNMVKNRKLSKLLNDSALGEVVRQLEYKTKRKGKVLLKIDQYFASSKLCSCCGWKKEDLTLNIRQWVCQGCNKEHQRDENAAKNILLEGLRQYAYAYKFDLDVQKSLQFNDLNINKKYLVKEVVVNDVSKSKGLNKNTKKIKIKDNYLTDDHKEVRLISWGTGEDMETDINLDSCTHIQTVESFQGLEIGLGSKSLKKEVLRNEKIRVHKLEVKALNSGMSG